MHNKRTKRSVEEDNTRARNMPRSYKLGKIPIEDEEWIALTDEMVAWSMLDDSFCIEDFPLSKGYSPHKFYKWVKYSPYFEEGLLFTRYKIGARRERAALERKVDPSFILKTMPLYNIEYKQLMLEKVQQFQKAMQNITVVVDPVENSPLVPERRIDEHQ